MKGIFPKKLSTKIILAVILSIILSFLFTGVVVYIISAQMIKEKVISDLRVQTRIIGSNCSAAILFDDKKAARDILSSLRSLEDIEFAVLYDKTGKEFVYYIREGSIYIPSQKEEQDSDEHIVISEIIRLDNEIIGKINVVSNMNTVRAQLKFVTYGVSLSVLISIVIALLLVIFFTRFIFKPVQSLISTMYRVSEENNFSLRADISSEDEFGDIARVFNEMLVQIQSREVELNRYREHLEDEVRRRTKELEELNKRLEEDLEEVRRMEEIISRSATEWRTTFDAIKDAVFLLDEGGYIIRCNKAASEIVGKDYNEINAKKVCDVAHISVKDECGLNEAIKEKKRIAKVLHMGEKVFQVYFDPIISQEKILGFVHIMSDITEKYNFDENIKQIQKMEAIGRLAGGIAHDFNNLLSIMTLYTGLLQKRLQGDERSQNELNEIKKVIEKATSLSKQLLAFSRKQILNPEVFDVNESLRANHKILSRLIGENIKIELMLSKEPACIFADKLQFDNVVMNMIINSRDAMPNGGIISIQTEVKSIPRDEIPMINVGSKKFVILRITDNGEGMSEEVRKKIFEPFFTTKPKGKGTGLGLSLVYGFVRQCDGYIDVRSKPQEGTTFTLYFPASKNKVETERPKSGLILGLSNTKLNILLVEDDDDVRRSVLKMLVENGFLVTDTSTAAEALSLLTSSDKKFDFIISDIVMPGMNGIEFYKKVSELNIKIPFLLMTGYSDDFLPQEDISLFKDMIIPKPFSEKEIVSKIHEMISMRR